MSHNVSFDGPMAVEQQLPPHGLNNEICCLIDDDGHCIRAAGNAVYNKRIQRVVLQRGLKFIRKTGYGIRKFSSICDYHKDMIIKNRSKRKRHDSDEDLMDHEYPDSKDNQPEVELINLQVNTLRRYKKHYKVSTKLSCSKHQLVECLMKHFHTIPVSEKECLTYFIYMIKNNRSKFDQRLNSNHANNANPSSSTDDL